jgi:predicted  nucleic acid-binding Zn-ribbon protein
MTQQFECAKCGITRLMRVADHEAALAEAVHAAEVATWAKAGAEHTAALAEAVKKEREACAQAAGPEDSYVDEWFKAKADSVARIRARSDK